jgi:phage-related protein
LTNNNFPVIICYVELGGVTVYTIVFYKDSGGKEPIGDYIRELAARNDKNSRINVNKINDYIEALSVYGTQAGEPYVKHLDGEIWELRPIRNRIFFAVYMDDSFVLLHHFIKKTQKTPSKEIERAKRELEDFRERLRRQREIEEGGNENE